MNSQALVIDFVKNWCSFDYDNYQVLGQDSFNIILIDTIPEFGEPIQRITILWTEVSRHPDDDIPDDKTKRLVRQIVKDFTDSTGTQITLIKHIGITTEITLKAVDLKTVSGFEWLNLGDNNDHLHKDLLDTV